MRLLSVSGSANQRVFIPNNMHPSKHTERWGRKRKAKKSEPTLK